MKIDLSDPSSEWIISKFMRTTYKLFQPKGYDLVIESRIEYVPIQVLGQLEVVDFQTTVIPSIVTWRKKDATHP